MNKYETFFFDVLSKTKSNDLKWTLEKRASHSGIIFNPSDVFRQFSANYEKDGDRYKLLFVEKKTPFAEYNFKEKYFPELLVIEDGELIFTMGDSLIELSDLIRLMEEIEKKSDKAKKLFR